MTTNEIAKPPGGMEDLKRLLEHVAQGSSWFSMTPTLLVDFFDGDHKAATLLCRILYWTDRATDSDGWFYKTFHDWQDELRFSAYQVRRVIQGDPRVEAPKRNLAEVGLERKVKMAPNGRNATFYRLDLAVFWEMFTTWLEERGHDLPTAPAEPETTPPVFAAYADRFGRLTPGIEKQLAAQRKRLGEEATRAVIERCAEHGQSWKYVLKALRNEKPQPVEAPALDEIAPAVATQAWLQTRKDTPRRTSSAAPPVQPTARLQENPAVQENWPLALWHVQGGIAIPTYRDSLDKVVLVDVDGHHFTAVVPASHLNWFENYVRRDVMKGLYDLLGGDLEDYQITVLTAAAWRDQQRE